MPTGGGLQNASNGGLFAAKIAGLEARAGKLCRPELPQTQVTAGVSG
jgi:hypothetical protein